VTTTLLAIDDSKTMRKVLEITFAGEDYRTVLAESSAEALAKLRGDNPAVALVDAHLGDESGYDLCQKIKREAPGVAVLILSSKQQPYDRARGTSAGADDYMDKPFDTQQLLDKVAVLLRRAQEAPLQAAKAPAAPAPQRVSAPTAPGLGVRPVAPAASPPAAPPQRTATAPGVGVRPLSVQSGGQQPPVGPIQPRPVVAARPAPTPAAAPPSPAQPPAAARAPSSPQAAPPPAPAARPAAPAPAAAPPAPPPPAPPAAAAMSAELPRDLASKLAGLGLTKDQVSGVLALSKDVVEQVVWEVVPMLAEAMIKEEIKRLTSD
jgi:CheY-like chemotaxis protein